MPGGISVADIVYFLFFSSIIYICNKYLDKSNVGRSLKLFLEDNLAFIGGIT